MHASTLVDTSEDAGPLLVQAHVVTQHDVEEALNLGAPDAERDVGFPRDPMTDHVARSSRSISRRSGPSVMR